MTVRPAILSTLLFALSATGTALAQASPRYAVSGLSVVRCGHG